MYFIYVYADILDIIFIYGFLYDMTNFNAKNTEKALDFHRARIYTVNTFG